MLRTKRKSKSIPERRRAGRQGSVTARRIPGEGKRAATTVRYQLRYQILPGDDQSTRIAELIEFCRRHAVEEVALFFAAEEWNNGLLSAAEEDIWFETVRTTKGLLDQAGVAASLNPWMTVLHGDRGRVFPADKDFAPMVSPTGEVSKACASFVCPNWRKYICDQYHRFAQLGFRVIWIEDDLRYHNHTPLTWGGGFEPEVIDRFSAKVGRPVTREDVVAAILKPGAVHPWRALWLDNWREILEEVVSLIRDAVQAGSPGKTILGLMTGAPDVLCAEGRDWQRLFASHSIDGQLAHRPFFAHYGEVIGKEKALSIVTFDVQRQLRPAGCKVLPEIENFPFTHWSKSDTQTWCEMALAGFYGADGLFLDLHPHAGRPDEPRIGALLDQSLPGLTWVKERFGAAGETIGVGMIWCSDHGRHARTMPGAEMEALYNRTNLSAGNLLLPYGVCVSTCRQDVNAMLGSGVWALTDEQIRELLAGGLMLDGEGADILTRRGFGKYLGVEVGECLLREQSRYSVEMMTGAETGVETGYCFNANHPLERAYRLRVRDEAQEWTRLLTPDRRAVGAGMTCYENALGGRVVVFAACDPGCLPPSDERQLVVQNAVRFACGGGDSVLVTGGAHLLPIHFCFGRTHRLVILNGMPDFAQPVVDMRGGVIQNLHCTLLRPLSEPESVATSIDESDDSIRIVADTSMPYLGYCVLEWDES